MATLTQGVALGWHIARLQRAWQSGQRDLECCGLTQPFRGMETLRQKLNELTTSHCRNSPNTLDALNTDRQDAPRNGGQTMKIAPVAACVALSFLGLSSLSKAEETKKPHTIAVLTFKNLRSSAETDWIGEGAAETLTTKLAGVPGLVVVERSQIKKMLDEQTFQQIGVTDPTNAVKLGKVLGVERIVIGTYTAQGGSVLFNVRVVDVETAQILNSASVTGTTEKIVDLLFQLAEAVIQSFDKTVVVVDARPVVQEVPASRRIVLAEEDRQRLRESGIATFFAMRAANDRGIAYILKRDHDRAIQNLNRAIELDPNSYLPYANRAVAYAAKGEFDLAIQDANRAIELDPNSHLPYVSRAMAYIGKGEFDRAIQDATRAIELKPSFGGYGNRAMAYIGKGEFDRAIQDATRAIELKPDNSTCYANRAVAYAAKGECDRAIRDANRAMKLEPNYPAGCAARAYAYLKKGDYGLAMQDCATALKINSKDANAYSTRAEIYFGLHEYEKAWADVRVCKKLGGGFGKMFRDFLAKLTKASGISE